MENEIVKQDDSKVAKYTNKQTQLIHDLYAKNTTEEEFELFMYTAGKYGLDPLLKQIWCVKFEKKQDGKHIGWEPAQIYAGRDGFIEIAHTRGNGQFNGLESGMKDAKTAYAKVYRKDMEHPFYIEVDMAEYSTGKALWGSKPKTMLTKVAESQALRKAFSISGIYSPEEMSQWELETQGINFNTIQPTQPQALATSTNSTQQPAYDRSKENPNDKPKEKINVKTGKPYTPKVARLYVIATKDYGLSNDDFKTLCIKVTGKEHSKDYTNKDCWDIEDKLIKGTPEIEDITEAEFEQMQEEFPLQNKVLIK